VTEVPPITSVVTEYQGHQLRCPACEEATRGELPVGVSSGPSVPECKPSPPCVRGADHLSKRTTQSVLEDLFGLPMSLGTLANLEQATVHALAEPVADARAYVQRQPTAYLDETGWREGRQRAWLWTAVTAGVTVFVVGLSGSRKVAQELLGERFWGDLVTDRWSAYSWYPSWRRQVCWAHLLREIEAMGERDGRSREIGEALRAQARQMFHWWHRVCDGTLSHASFARYRWPLRREVERLLAAGQTCGVPKTEGTCRDILKRRQALWTFVRHEGVEPTNNAAERAIRPGVLWRKGSFGTQSSDGSRLVETMMTVVATLKQQHRQVLTYVTATCAAVLWGRACAVSSSNPGDLKASHLSCRVARS
jgi:transposase